MNTVTERGNEEPGGASCLGRVLHYVRILASGVFAHSAYARVYLGSRLYLPFALVHYVAVGEARGNRPHPFFDPLYSPANLSAGGGAAFARFLSERRSGPACAEFDADWYVERHPQVAASGLSAWEHYRRHGLTHGEDPAPDVSLEWILRIHKRRRGRLLRDLMGLFARRVREPWLPLSHVELARNQQAFRDTVDLDLRQALPERRHRDLVFVQTNGRHEPSLHDGARRFDLMLNLYAEPEGALGAADYVVRQSGTKSTAIALLLKHHPHLLLRYDRVLFLDDDVEIAPETIATFFAVMDSERLDLAQPSLTADSSSYFPVLMQQGGRAAPWRPVTAVEIMMPALSRRALETCGSVFARGISGYGIDILLGAQVRSLGWRVGVVDRAVARHATPVDSENGTFYRYLKSRRIDPMIEMWDMLDGSGETNRIEAEPAAGGRAGGTGAAGA
ncbi:hypothetical protein MWN34_13930 [Ancylobacter sp. 6x-1]|uniref:Uncharacterized protein n=1 Tax=Ancylobacter crimeensis TaxID=2579147 RepID=A0ABT0DDQ5_9HYPH|nr:hypothetical protein [Ancylobacter crimeensis]MCK0198009.1 hypothetical protein [Ancylobacter crimeensis]